MTYNFDKTAKVGKWVVKYDTAAKYGFYEHDDQGEGGGLWVDQDGTLSDFDGRAVLPKNAALALIELGIKVDLDLFC